MRTPYFLLLLMLLFPSISFAWIPETADLYKDKQIEPSLRPEEELKEIESERTPTSTSGPFEFRQEHMKKILEENY